MGHYASEIDPNWGKSAAELKAEQDQSFKVQKWFQAEMADIAEFMVAEQPKVEISYEDFADIYRLSLGGYYGDPYTDQPPLYWWHKFVQKHPENTYDISDRMQQRFDGKYHREVPRISHALDRTDGVAFHLITELPSQPITTKPIRQLAYYEGAEFTGEDPLILLDNLELPPAMKKGRAGMLLVPKPNVKLYFAERIESFNIIVATDGKQHQVLLNQIYGHQAKNISAADYKSIFEFKKNPKGKPKLSKRRA